MNVECSNISIVKVSNSVGNITSSVTKDRTRFNHAENVIQSGLISVTICGFQKIKWCKSLHFISSVHCQKETFYLLILAEKQIISLKLRGYGTQGDLCLFFPCYFLTITIHNDNLQTKYHHPCRHIICHTILRITYDLPSHALNQTKNQDSCSRKDKK